MAGTSPAMTNVTARDELTRLEAERDRLLSMIAYHRRPMLQMPAWFQIPQWFRWVSVGMICAIGVLILAGIFAGQISPWGVIFLVVGLPALAYISTRKIALFGVTFHVGEVLVVLLSSPEHPVSPARQPAGEPQALQRLADCEARIMKLRESNS
jgi:hypothetical protein